MAEVSGIAVPDSYKLFFAQWQRMLAEYESAGYAVQHHRAAVSGRMAVGTGIESVLETAIALHKTYGVPLYFSGSALKGLAANFARHYCGDIWKRESENYKIAFGETAESGCVMFFDALYTPDSGFDRRPLHPDVMTV